MEVTTYGIVACRSTGKNGPVQLPVLDGVLRRGRMSQLLDCIRDIKLLVVAVLGDRYPHCVPARKCLQSCLRQAKRGRKSGQNRIVTASNRSHPRSTLSTFRHSRPLSYSLAIPLNNPLRLRRPAKGEATYSGEHKRRFRQNSHTFLNSMRVKSDLRTRPAHSFL